MDLLNHCLINYFQFNGQFYQQVKGMPMGSPISVLIAEAVLQRFEAKVFKTFTPKLWKRYVDDTFGVRPSAAFLRPIKSAHTCAECFYVCMDAHKT